MVLHYYKSGILLEQQEHCEKHNCNTFPFIQYPLQVVIMTLERILSPIINSEGSNNNNNNIIILKRL